VQLKGWRIAGIHAELSQRDDGVYVSDTSGDIGTFVNSEAVKQFGPLSVNDEIGIGSYRLSVSSDSKNASAGVHSCSSQLQPLVTGDDPQKSSPGISSMRSASPSPHAEAVSDNPEAQHATDTPTELPERFVWHKRIHVKLMEAMDVRRTDVESMDDALLTKTVKMLITGIIEKIDQDIPANIDRARLAKDVLNEAIGLGPLEDLLADDAITEIMVNRYDNIFYELRGKLHKSDVTFSSDDAVLAVIERIVAPLGRRIDESSPMVDGRLKDGSRVNAVIPPLALKGPCLTIRKFFKKKLTVEDLINSGSITADVITFLHAAVEHRKNIIISGGTGSGKTTFLNLLTSFIPHDERIITVEDSAELQLEQPHVVTLEARPANMEGKGAIVIRDLVKNCLRMRPDRIVVGECRGMEALDMLQAMNTGHDGSLTTLHANSPRDAVSRLEVMVMMAGMELPEKAILQQIASAVNIVVQQARFADGSRKITHVAEITGMESGVVQMQNLFVYKQSGLDSNGKVLGSLKSTGSVPEFYEALRDCGVAVDMSIFDQEL